MSINHPIFTNSEWRDGPIEDEEWRDAVFDDITQPAVTIYQVSNLGRVRSRANAGTKKINIRWRLLDGYTSPWGYQVFTMNGARRYVHRLVAFAFIGLPEPNQVVRHLDGNPFNNVVSNLAWGSAADNTEDRVRHGRTTKGTRNGNSKITDDDAREIVRRWQSGELRYQISRHFKITPESVGNIVGGRTWRHATGLSPTPKDQDRWQARGERNHSKLTRDDVLHIVSRCRAGESRRAVARAFKVSSPTVMGIMAGRIWWHVTGIPKQFRKP